jgi:hypothetical protein
MVTVDSKISLFVGNSVLLMKIKYEEQYSVCV